MTRTLILAIGLLTALISWSGTPAFANVANQYEPNKQASASCYTADASKQLLLCSANNRNTVLKNAESVVEKGIRLRKKQIDVRKYKLSRQEIENIEKNVHYKHPDLFYFGRGRSTFKNGKVSQYRPYYLYSKKVTAKKSIQLERKALEAVSWTTPEMSEAERAKALHDFLVRNGRYAQRELDEGKITDKDMNAYSMIVNGKGNCQAYALAYMDLLSRVGIESYIVSGYYKTYKHCWNLVKLDGAYYHVDVTSDDPTDPKTYKDGGYNGKVKDFLFARSDSFLKGLGYRKWSAPYAARSTKFDGANSWAEYKGAQKALCGKSAHHRLANPLTGKHKYADSKSKAKTLINRGWRYEGFRSNAHCLRKKRFW